MEADALLARMQDAGSPQLGRPPQVVRALENFKMAVRDYTPRGFDPVALTLEIDFALHGAGPATRWEAQAQGGQRLGVGGPRGSFIRPTDFDGHLLIGDDTALPAIARRLAELPAQAPIWWVRATSPRNGSRRQGTGAMAAPRPMTKSRHKAAVPGFQINTMG